MAREQAPRPPMDSLTGATRTARAGSCWRCRGPVMRGLDRDRGGVSADCDPGALSPLGEALALLAGRRTYELRWLHDHYELTRRDSRRISAEPAGTTVGTDVLANHECNSAVYFPGIVSRHSDRADWMARTSPVDSPF